MLNSLGVPYKAQKAQIEEFFTAIATQTKEPQSARSARPNQANKKNPREIAELYAKHLKNFGEKADQNSAPKILDATISTFTYVLSPATVMKLFVNKEKVDDPIYIIPSLEETATVETPLTAIIKFDKNDKSASEKIICLIQEFGADPNKGAANDTPLIQALMDGRVSIVEALLKNGASQDCKDANNHAPMRIARDIEDKSIKSKMINLLTRYSATDEKNGSGMLTQMPKV